MSQSTFEDNNEDLLTLLVDDWQDPVKDTVIESKWTRSYLTRLASLSLKELVHEPQHLKDEQAKSIREAQQLAFREYPSFLHAQTCRHQVEETLNGLDLHLGEFTSFAAELPAAFKEFEQEAKIIKEERDKITSVLEYQNVLTDLLEIPQLMETCVRNGYYSEAMDLASHVRLLQVRYPLSVIKNIQEQVQASSDLMLVQLVSHLRKPIRLAAAMNVVGFLRRMDIFGSETELRMVFLRCRHDYLQQRLARAKRDISEDTRQKSSDAFDYLKRFIDIMREQMFEIGTQYISIFSNEQGSLLSDYMVHVMEFIRSALHTYLPMIEDTSALASLLTQLQYCGMSLGRIGLDFRHIFVHSFEEALQPILLQWMDSTTEELVQFISKALENNSAPSTWMSSKISAIEETRRHAFQPPMLLVNYPSLAVFTNGILSTFNALRLLPAISLYAPIENHLDACFFEIGAVLKQYCDRASSHNELSHLQSFSSAYVRCCLPFLKSCLVDGIYGQLSVPSTVDQDMELLLVNYLPVIEKDAEVVSVAPEETNEEDKLDGKETEDTSEEKQPVDEDMTTQEGKTDKHETENRSDEKQIVETNEENKVDRKETEDTSEEKQPVDKDEDMTAQEDKTDKHETENLSNEKQIVETSEEDKVDGKETKDTFEEKQTVAKDEEEDKTDTKETGNSFDEKQIVETSEEVVNIAAKELDKEGEAVSEVPSDEKQIVEKNEKVGNIVTKEADDTKQLNNSSGEKQCVDNDKEETTEIKQDEHSKEKRATKVEKAKVNGNTKKAANKKGRRKK